MKSTLADNKQLFNVKAIATAGLAPADIPADTLGIIDEATGLTVVPANFGALPAKFFMVGKLNGKVYYSFDTIEKEKLRNLVATDYKAPSPESWIATIECCNCIDSVQLNLNIDEASLIQRDGLTWTHRDFVVEVAPQELKCLCSCDGTHKVYENNVLTNLLVEKVNAMNSPFYSASVMLDTSTFPTGTALPSTGSEVLGEFFILTTDNELYLYDGTSWVLVGSYDGVISDADALIAILKDLNTDDDDTNDGPLLSIAINGKVQPAPYYNDLEVNYVYPRGVKLHPAIMAGNCTTEFTKIQDMEYEIGAGYDLRAEEFENMSYYTDLNHYPQLSDGIKNPAMVYQFENSTNYNTVTFEFMTDKTYKNEGDKRLFGVMLGTSVGGVYTALKAMFGL